MSPGPAEGVIFDMDGVLVQSEVYWSEELETILGTALPADADVEPADVTGISIYDQYDRLSARYDLRVDREEYFDLFDRVAESVYLERADPTDGGADLVRELSDAGLPVGLATSSFPQWVEWVLERLGLEDEFDAVVTGPEIERTGKPEPHIYREAASRLGVAPGRCVVVEDSANGVRAATSAGAYTIGYRPPGSDGEQDISAADEIAEGPAELRERLLAVALGDDASAPRETGP